MHKGSCLCGAVGYQISSEPFMVANCHCKMCQKQHGAPFATYAVVKVNELQYTSGEDNMTSYNSSSTIQRKFCTTCGSNVEWGGHPEYPNWVSVPLSTFDTSYTPKEVGNYHTETKCPWV